jgi:predicted transporter
MNLAGAILSICILFMVIVPSMAASGEDIDVEVLESHAQKLAEVKNYENAGGVYERIALYYENDSEWESASGYYLLAAENFEKSERYESAGSAYINAGDCFYEVHDCDNASEYYSLGAESHKRADPGYDDTWIAEKLKECREKSVMSTLAILGILLGMTKFASKAAFGLGFAAVGRREISAIAGIYFFIPLLMSAAIGIMRETLYGFINTLFTFKIAFGAFQLTMALLLLTLGLYTIRKWKDKRDVSKRTFLLMALPCPVSVVTMFMTCAFFIITRMGAVKVGLLVGGIFSLSILGITFTIQKSSIEKSPSNLGTVMIFFGMLYLLSIVLIPAYLPVYNMNIVIAGVSTEDMISGSLFAAVMIFIGFLVERIKNRKMEWNYSRN